MAVTVPNLNGRWLDEWIAARRTDELRSTVRFLHRAIASRGRLGWSTALFEEPAIVAALCLALTAELVRREERTMVCGPCAATVAAARAPIAPGGLG